MVDDVSHRCRDVVDREREVTVASVVRHRQRPRYHIVVAVNLQRRPVRSAARQPQVHPLKTGPSETGGTVQPSPSRVALWRHRLASEDLHVEADQLTPVTRDDVGVDVFGAADHPLDPRTLTP